MADNALRQGEVIRPKNQQARNVARYKRAVAKHRAWKALCPDPRRPLVARVRS